MGLIRLGRMTLPVFWRLEVAPLGWFHDDQLYGPRRRLVAIDITGKVLLKADF